MVARLPDGSWSAPSAIALGGLGGGGQIGMELTDFVFVLNTDAAVQTFLESGNITMGGNVSLALGPGRSAETGAIIGTNGVAGMYAYSKTRGVYGGATLEASVILERSSANKKMYERKLKAMQLLNGEIPPPPQAEPLMHILNSGVFRERLSDGTSDTAELPAEALSEPAQRPSELAAGSQRPSELAAESLSVPELDGQSSPRVLPSVNTHREAEPQYITRSHETAESQGPMNSPEVIEPQQAAITQEETETKERANTSEATESEKA